jgi:LysM repeat protein
MAAGIPNEAFFRFNPGFKPGVEPPAHAYKLLLPREQAQTLAANAPGARLLVPSKHTVQKGETLDMIAKRHGVASEQLAQWNGLNSKGRLKAGQQLIVYPSS